MDVKYDLNNYVRVLKLASAPSWQEFLQISKIAGVGIFPVGLFGFIVSAVMSFLPGGV